MRATRTISRERSGFDNLFLFPSSDQIHITLDVSHRRHTQHELQKNRSDYNLTTSTSLKSNSRSSSRISYILPQRGCVVRLKVVSDVNFQEHLGAFTKEMYRRYVYTSRRMWKSTSIDGQNFAFSHLRIHISIVMTKWNDVFNKTDAISSSFPQELFVYQLISPTMLKRV